MEPCIATPRFMARRVRGPPVDFPFIRMLCTCSIRPRMAAKHPQTSIPANKWTEFRKRKSADGKITMGGGLGMPRRSPIPHCASTREKCTLIFRNNADERRISLIVGLKRCTVKYFSHLADRVSTPQAESRRRMVR